MVIFFLDASESIGFGHLSRCMRLAEELKNQGVNSALVGCLSEHAHDWELNVFCDVRELSAKCSIEQRCNELMDIATHLNATTVVTDVKEKKLPPDFHILLEKQNLKWLQFKSSFSDTTWADMAISQNISICQDGLQKCMLRPGATALAGLQYCLVDNKHNRSISDDEVRERIRLLITFGNGDDRGAINSTLKAINCIGENFEVKIASGVSNPSNVDLQRFCDQTAGKFDLIIGRRQLFDFMHQADFCILSGGTVSLEAVSVGVPMILIAIAKDQARQAQMLADLGVAIYVGKLENLNEDVLRTSIQTMVKESTRLVMRKKSQTLGLDGFGPKSCKSNA